MKTIAVLTDFSKRAENAAKYALHLAEHLHANVKLYNSFFVPSDNPMAAQIVWPMENYEELKLDSIQQLELFATKLKTEYSTKVAGTFKPEIEYECHDGDLSSYLKVLEADKEVILLVLGNHEKSALNWLKGNHLNDVMDHATLPVLVIAAEQKFATIKKIAFATDLSLGDIEQIHSLAGLAKAFNAEIVLVHVADDGVDEDELHLKVECLLAEVATKINFGKVYYRRLKNDDTADGLEWLNKTGQIDMMVMVHRHKTFFQELFVKSISKKIASKNHLPLVIYPSKVASVPVF